jgi:hypothetical protein
MVSSMESLEAAVFALEPLVQLVLNDASPDAIMDEIEKLPREVYAPVVLSLVNCLVQRRRDVDATVNAMQDPEAVETLIRALREECDSELLLPEMLPNEG